MQFKREVSIAEWQAVHVGGIMGRGYAAVGSLTLTALFRGSCIFNALLCQ